MNSDWFGFYFQLDERMVLNFLSQSCSIVEEKSVTFQHSNEKCSILIYDQEKIIIHEISNKMTLTSFLELLMDT